MDAGPVHERPITKRDPMLYGIVTLQVEDTLYQVHRKRLESLSPFFKELFRTRLDGASTDQSTNTNTVDSQVSNTITLDDCTKVEFGHLARFLYPHGDWIPGETGPTFTKEAWMSTLRLSTHWKMAKVRHKAINELTASLNSGSCTGILQQVQLAREYNVPDWFTSAIEKIVNSPNLSGLSLDNLGSSLGWETAAKILWIANPSTASLSSGIGTGSIAMQPRGTLTQDKTALIKEIFSDELKGLASELDQGFLLKPQTSSWSSRVAWL